MNTNQKSYSQEFKQKPQEATEILNVDNYEGILDKLDAQLMTMPNNITRSICEMIKAQLGSSSLKEGLGQLQGLPLDIAMMTLSLIFPEMSSSLRRMTELPLERFPSTKEALAYLDALVRSGVAAQSDRGLMFVMGNTATGCKNFEAHDFEATKRFDEI